MLVACHKTYEKIARKIGNRTVRKGQARKFASELTYSYNIIENSKS
jgi:hypothetical protein